MRVAVTGTPGTGKTTVTERVETDLDVVHLNEVIREAGLYGDVDEDRDSAIADLDAVAEWVAANAGQSPGNDTGRTGEDGAERSDDWLVESHLAHYLDADRVVVLRCAPAEIERRLVDRGESDASASENAESEALDVILAEAVDRHGRDRVYEIDTTDREPATVAREIEAVIAGERDPSAGTVEFTGYLQNG